MKTSHPNRKHIAAMVTALTLSSLSAGAQNIYLYDASLGTFPEAQGFTLYDNGGGAPTVSGGVLHQPGNPNGGGYQFWYATNRVFTFSSNSYAVEITLRVLSAADACGSTGEVHGFQFEVIDSAGYQVGATIGTGAVSLYANSPSTNRAFNAADGFHTYRVQIGKGAAVLFIDNALFASAPFVEPPNHPDQYADRVDFGDGSGCGTSDVEIRFYRFQSLATTLTIEPFGVSEVRLSWNSLDNYKYQTQRCSDLTTSAWNDWGAPVQGNGTTKSITDSLGGSQRFYRLIVLHD